ncbi:MAG: hypothetical protein ACK5HR_04580 [Mycoplasmatales bacterium]
MPNKNNQIIINLTPHDITLITDENKIIFPKSEKICRVEFKKTELEKINNIQVKQIKLGDIINYPNEQDKIYIVSSIVGMQLAKLDYKNYLVPDTDDSIRDERGNIIAVKNFMKY